jgi:hypothetical protein
MKHTRPGSRIFNYLAIDLRIFKVMPVITFLTCAGCRCDYKINEERIRAGCEISHGLKMSKIEVDSFNADGIPVKYLADTVVLCTFKGKNDPSFEAERTIMLKEANESYEWFFFDPYIPENRSKIFPLRFLPGSWYQLVSLQSSDEKENFIYVNDDGSMSQYTVYKPGPF